MSAIRIRPIAAVLVSLGIVAVGCAASPSPSAPTRVPSPSASASAVETPFPAALSSNEPYEPVVDPAAFTATVDNPYFPLPAGARWVMEGSGESAGEVTTTLVTDQTKTIMGVVCAVVRDEVKADGELQELTFDWYAQDADGNVWYFGEDTAEYKNGEVTSREGSWEAGVDGAQPGHHHAGRSGRGPHLPAGVLRRPGGGSGHRGRARCDCRHACWPVHRRAGHRGLDAARAGHRERKFYAPGVGLVKERDVQGGHAMNDLTEFTPRRTDALTAPQTYRGSAPIDALPTIGELPTGSVARSPSPGGCAIGRRRSPCMAATTTSVPGDRTPSLERDAIGLPEVLFQCITHMAPAVATALSIGAATIFAGGLTPLAVVFAMVACLFTAYSIGQLARHLPSAGGMYTYVTRGLGPFFGWLMAWAFALAEPLIAPILLAAFGFFGAAFLATYLHIGEGFTEMWIVLAIACGLLLWWLIYRGVAISTRTGVVLGIIEIAIFLLRVRRADRERGRGQHAERVHPRRGRRGPAFQGMIFCLLAFIGFEAAAPMGEETREPRRTIPRAVIWSTILVGAFYVFNYVRGHGVLRTRSDEATEFLALQRRRPMGRHGGPKCSARSVASWWCSRSSTARSPMRTRAARRQLARSSRWARGGLLPRSSSPRSIPPIGPPQRHPLPGDPGHRGGGWGWPAAGRRPVPGPAARSTSTSSSAPCWDCCSPACTSP